MDSSTRIQRERCNRVRYRSRYGSAAGILGLSDTNAREESYSNLPSGCYWQSEDGYLIYHTPNDAGSSSSSSFSCLCEVHRQALHTTHNQTGFEALADEIQQIRDNKDYPTEDLRDDKNNFVITYTKDPTDTVCDETATTAIGGILSPVTTGAPTD